MAITKNTPITKTCLLQREGASGSHNIDTLWQKEMLLNLQTQKKIEKSQNQKKKNPKKIQKKPSSKWITEVVMFQAAKQATER